MFTLLAYYMELMSCWIENSVMSDLRYIPTENKKDEKDMISKFKVKFSGRLKEIRKEKKVSQEELAYKAGLNFSYVGHLEAGTYSPTLYVVWKLSQALGVSLSEFVSDFP